MSPNAPRKLLLPVATSLYSIPPLSRHPRTASTLIPSRPTSRRAHSRYEHTQDLKAGDYASTMQHTNIGLPFTCRIPLYTAITLATFDLVKDHFAADNLRIMQGALKVEL